MIKFLIDKIKNFFFNKNINENKEINKNNNNETIHYEDIINIDKNNKNKENDNEYDEKYDEENEYDENENENNENENNENENNENNENDIYEYEEEEDKENEIEYNEPRFLPYYLWQIPYYFRHHRVKRHYHYLYFRNFKRTHNYFILLKSPWPLIFSIIIFILFSKILLIINNKNSIFNLSLFFFFIIFIWLLYSTWFKDIIKEENILGLNTKNEISMKHLGINMFLFSEVMLFFSFFFVFSFLVLKPNSGLGFSMPHPDINYPNPFSTVLLNTIILLISGYAITLSHHYLLEKKLIKKSSIFLLICIFLGCSFLMGQFIEYLEAPFTISDGLLGCTFYMLTGLHGCHVILAILILISIFLIYLQYLPIYRFLFFHFAYIILAFCRYCLVICLFFCIFYNKYIIKPIYYIFSIK